MPDIEYLKGHFRREGRISEEQALYIIEKATEILRTEPNLLSVDAPVAGEFLSPLPVIMICGARCNTLMADRISHYSMW